MEERELFLQALGERIVFLRQSKSISQAELAHVSNMESSSLRKIEKGRINPTVWTLRRLCETLNVSLPVLLDFESDPGK